jgi:hypothetical protein
MKSKNFSMVILGTVLVFGSFMSGCASGSRVRSDFSNPAEQKEDYAYVSATEGVQIFSIDGLLTSIPIKKNRYYLFLKASIQSRFNTLLIRREGLLPLLSSQI